MGRFGSRRGIHLIAIGAVLSTVLAGGVAAAAGGELGADSTNSQPALTAQRWGVGLDPRFDIESVMAMESPTGTLCLYLGPSSPWDAIPPDYFSWFLQIMALDHLFGTQRHDGVSEGFGQNAGPFASGPDVGGEWRLMSNGSLIVDSGIPLDSQTSVSVEVAGGHLRTEDANFESVAHVFSKVPVESAQDCFSYEGESPVYDTSRGVPIEAEPVVTETTQAAVTETTQAAVTETTQAAVTATTQPAATATEEVTTTTRPRTVTRETTPSSKGDACWWCWGVVLLFVAVLLCILYIWLKTYEWWTCWIPWFIVIFVWAPFLLAGLWWWRPAWWWVPLLAWFPIIIGYTWFWAQRRSWWQPWHLYVVAGYLGALILGMFFVGSPEWGLLLPLFWVPWVAFYFWYRGRRQAWFRPWMWVLGIGYVAWIFIWVIALSPWWAWWWPVVFFPFAGWWFITNGYRWREIVGPKWCWVLPFAFLPFLAWWIPLWGPWWCFVIIGFLALVVVCAIFNHFMEEEWWTCWLFWFLFLWIWAPFWLLGLWWFQPNWWMLGLLPWFLVIPWLSWWYGSRRSWWLPQYWTVVWGYLLIAAVLMFVVGSPTWGLLLGWYWVPPVAFYLWYRPRRRPWFRPWMWGLFGAYVAWIFIWAIWLTPWWGWWFPVFVVPFLGWWYLDHGYEWDVWMRKSCFLIPLLALPWLGYMLAIDCIPRYYF